MTIVNAAKPRDTLPLAFGCLMAMGLAGGLLGVAWPSIRASFGLPLDALIALLATSTIGFVAGSVLAGRVMSRLTVGRSLMINNFIGGVAYFAMALAPGWWVFVAFGLFTGWAGGLVVTTLNIYVAATHSVRAMNWMHACFGVGATFGPLVMTTVVGMGLGWRWGYAAAGLAYLALGLASLPFMRLMTFRGMAHDRAAGGDGRAAAIGETLRLPILWLSVLLCLLYTGVETTAGQWMYTLFTESRGASAVIAGTMTSVFWAMLTLGRVVLGAAASRVGAERLLLMCMIGMVLATVLLAWRAALTGYAAIVLLGLSCSAVFPTLTAHTPHRVGRRHAANTIGLQTSGASIGLALLPGVAGIIAERHGLEALGPYMVLTATMMLLVNQITVRQGRRSSAGPYHS